MLSTKRLFVNELHCFDVARLNVPLELACVLSHTHTQTHTQPQIRDERHASVDTSTSSYRMPRVVVAEVLGRQHKEALLESLHQGKLALALRITHKSINPLSAPHDRSPHPPTAQYNTHMTRTPPGQASCAPHTAERVRERKEKEGEGREKGTK